jgi:hypothetical protein
MMRTVVAVLAVLVAAGCGVKKPAAVPLPVWLEDAAGGAPPRRWAFSRGLRTCLRRARTAARSSPTKRATSWVSSGRSRTVGTRSSRTNGRRGARTPHLAAPLP